VKADRDGPYIIYTTFIHLLENKSITAPLERRREFSELNSLLAQSLKFAFCRAIKPLLLQNGRYAVEFLYLPVVSCSTTAICSCLNGWTFYRPIAAINATFALFWL
jgi:hypothetical protein